MFTVSAAMFTTFPFVFKVFEQDRDRPGAKHQRGREHDGQD